MSSKFNNSTDHFIKEYILALQDLFHRAIQISDGCKTWYDLSYYTDYEEYKGNLEVIFKKEYKYEDVLQIFKKDIPNSNFQFETTVTKIDYSNDKIKIASQDGSEFLADILIFTGSLGILKEKGEDMFYPKLPKDKLKAINEIGYGIVDKIYLEFSSNVFDSSISWQELLFEYDGISYSSEDASNDWTRFLAAYNVINEKLASFWLTGNFFSYRLFSITKIRNILL